jgi:hypothetical protein
MASMGLGWEKFNGFQLLGFLFSLSGTLVFNEVVIPPFEIFRENTKANIAKR